jgi:hypothetical protein
LLEGAALVPFRNRTNVLNHALFPRFQSFITPFLYPRLNESMNNTKPEQWQTGLTYIPLLHEREADLVQSTIYEQLRVIYQDLENQISWSKREEDLLRAVRLYLNPQLIATLNLFTPSFYRVKTAWIRILKQVAYHPAGTKRMVMHLIGELKSLQLNPDHSAELRELEREIRIGAVKVEDAPVPARRIVMTVVGALLIALLIYVVFWIVPADPERDLPQERTAFMDFTVEERRTMDSLLQNLKMERRHNDAIDGGDMTYVGEELVVKIPWKNQDAEYIVSHWKEKDSINRTPRPEDSKKEYRAFPMTEPLKEKNGSVRAKFQNDTELSVLVVVFKDRADEWVYSQYVEKHAVVNFKLYPEEHMLVLPGSKVPKHLNAGALPFEQVDSRFFDNLDNTYTVDYLSPSSVKFVWKQLNNYDFYLLDVSGALNKE